MDCLRVRLDRLTVARKCLLQPGRRRGWIVERLEQGNMIGWSQDCRLVRGDGMDVTGHGMGHTENVAHFCTRFSEIAPVALGLLEVEISP